MRWLRSYGGDWDDYVKRWEKYARLEPTNQGRSDLVFPGDEWGTEASWDEYAATFLHPYLPADGRGTAAEIGPGSGKYTLRVVDRVARLICFDVSKKFMKVARARLAAHGARADVRFELLKLADHREIQQAVGRIGAQEKIDLFYSVDSMQHVELHTLAAYWIAAAEVLRPGGHLVMTVGNCTTEQGFDRLLSDVKRCYGRFQSAHQFYYLSRDLVASCLDRLGFEVVSLTEGRDINFVARKARAPRSTIPAP